MTPEKLGRYEIVKELGKGAMGVVYLARDPLIGRQLAIKTFRLGYDAPEREMDQFRTRFLREAQSAGILNHPNIVTIHDVVEEADGGYFIAMEYVQGVDLKQQVQRQGRLKVDYALDVVAQVAEGLAYAHSKGVVHRDVKPANIIITADQVAKITDFGIARIEASKLTVKGQLLGTPNYMAPEQIRGLPVDHRADIFSLGVLLYEVVTGKKPFHGENVTVVTHRVVYDPFVPPQDIVSDLPAGLNQILDRALQKVPEKRYEKCAQMAEELREVQYAVVKTVPLAELPTVPIPTGVVKTPPARKPPAPATRETPAAPSRPVAKPAPIPEPPKVPDLPRVADFATLHVTPAPPVRKSASAPPSAIEKPPTGSPPKGPKPSPAETRPGAIPPPPPSARTTPPATPPPPSAVREPGVRPPTGPVTRERPAVPAAPPAPPSGPSVRPPTGLVTQKLPPASPVPYLVAESAPSGVLEPAGREEPPPVRAEKPPAAPPTTDRAAVARAKPAVSGPLVGPPPPRAAPSTPVPPQRTGAPSVKPAAGRAAKSRERARGKRRGRWFWSGVVVAVLLMVAGLLLGPREQRQSGPPGSLPVEPQLFAQRPRFDPDAPSTADGDDLVRGYVDERLAAAAAYHEENDDEKAREYLTLVLMIDPENERARELEKAIPSGLAQSQQPGTPPSSPAPAAVAPAAGRRAPPAAPRQGTIEIVFDTHFAEGQVTVYAGDNVKYQKPFLFEKKSVFSKKAKQPQGFSDSFPMPPGVFHLKVEIQLDIRNKDLKHQSDEVGGSLRPGAKRTLRVTISDQGLLEVEVE